MASRPRRDGKESGSWFVNDIGRRVVCSEEPVACSRGGEGRSHEAPLALLSAEGNGPKWEWLKRLDRKSVV